MKLLTIAELRVFHNKKTEFLALKNMSERLEKYKLKSLKESKDYESVAIIDTCILDVSNEIEKLKRELEVEENEVIKTINTVWDDVAKKALIMHYVKGICWNTIANELGGWKDGCGARAMAYRGLKRVDKRYKNRSPN